MNKFVGPTRCLKLVSKGFCQVKVICHNPDDLGSILKTPMVEKKNNTAGCLLSPREHYRDRSKPFTYNYAFGKSET